MYEHAHINNCCVHHLLKTLDVQAVVVSNKFALLRNKFVLTYGSIFRNYFVTNFTFKADLGMIMIQLWFQMTFFYDTIKHILNKTFSKENINSTLTSNHQKLNLRSDLITKETDAVPQRCFYKRIF